MKGIGDKLQGYGGELLPGRGECPSFLPMPPFCLRFAFDENGRFLILTHQVWHRWHSHGGQAHKAGAYRNCD